MLPFKARPVPRTGILLLVLMLAACNGLPDVPSGQGAPVSSAAASPSASDYLIGPGDSLGIFVYRAPELSVDVPVRPDGRISLPLVPEVEASGRTPVQLARAIEERLRQYVREPNVTVFVKSFVGPTSTQVRVVGEAAQPRSIQYREGLTVLDVVIQTGGLTRYAAGNRAQIVRRAADGRPQTLRVRLSDLLRDGDISQDVAMQPGDTLVIPQGWF